MELRLCVLPDLPPLSLTLTLHKSHCMNLFVCISPHLLSVPLRFTTFSFHISPVLPPSLSLSLSLPSLLSLSLTLSLSRSAHRPLPPSLSFYPPSVPHHPPLSLSCIKSICPGIMPTSAPAPASASSLSLSGKPSSPWERN